MLLGKTKLQLIAFVVVSLLAIGYALIRFTGLGDAFGTKGYTVRLQLAQSGGIFQNAEVTYRGYNIGRVGELRLTATGLEAELRIDSDAPAVPADLRAVVANRSAVGEQYVDLRPSRSDGPVLSEGTVIPVENTKTPIRTDQLIGDLDSLVSSVPVDSLRTVVDESYLGFSSTGPSLQVLLDTVHDFTKTAQQYLPQTVQLIDSGAQVLATQNAEAGSLKSFSADLNKLTATLKSSDGDLRKLIESTPQAAQQISGLLAESGSGLGALFANLLTTSNLLVTRQAGLEQIFVAYPILSAGAQTVVPGDGTAHLGLVLNLFNPPPCTQGYLTYDQYRGGNGAANLADRPAKLDAYCAEPQGSPINVRGAGNAPYNGVAKLPSGQQVQQNSSRPAEELAANRATRGVPGIAGAPGLAITSLGQLLGLP